MCSCGEQRYWERGFELCSNIVQLQLNIALTAVARILSKYCSMFGCFQLGPREETGKLRFSKIKYFRSSSLIQIYRNKTEWNGKECTPHTEQAAVSRSARRHGFTLQCTPHTEQAAVSRSARRHGFTLQQSVRHTQNKQQWADLPGGMASHCRRVYATHRTSSSEQICFTYCNVRISA
jgi:hypothetical protein